MEAGDSIAYARLRRDILINYLNLTVPQLEQTEMNMALWDYFHRVLTADQLVQRIRFGNELAEAKKRTAALAAHARALDVYLEIYE